eukprot:2856623-Amphidinium_carterae.2
MLLGSKPATKDPEKAANFKQLSEAYNAMGTMHEGEGTVLGLLLHELWGEGKLLKLDDEAHQSERDDPVQEGTRLHDASPGW